jgi:hypothetical protein
MKNLIIAVAALALSASAVGVSQAQDSNPPPAAGGGNSSVREACAADLTKLCANVDRSAIRQCIKDNFSQLSDGCKSAIMAARAARQSSNGGEASASH